MRVVVLGGLVLLILAACSEPQKSDSKQAVYSSYTVVTGDAGKGRNVFSANCALCHGNSGVGSDQGPPLIHKIYRPAHHSDYSIERAIKFGVKSHHWGFGNMAAIPSLSSENIKHVIAYIRQEQVNAGIQ